MAKQQTVLERAESLKAAIEKGRAEKNIMEGERKSVVTQLDKGFGVTTLTAADEKLDDLEATEKRLNSEIEKGVTELESRYQW